MRKSIILLLNLSFMISVSFAQSEQYAEGFETEFFRVPDGWGTIGNANQWSRRTNGGQPDCDPYSGSAMMRFRTSFGQFSQTIYSPRIDWSKRSNYNTYVSFYLYRDSQNTNDDSLSVLVNTEPSLDGATWIGGVARYTKTNKPDSVNEGWKKYSFLVPTSFNGNRNYFLLQGHADRGNSIYIDSVEWEGYPTFCEGKPKAGKIKSTPEIICTTQGTAFFELTGASDETGTSIKWEYADSANHANGNWTTINTTNTSWQANITNNYYFRAIVFCEKSKMSDTTEEYFLFVDVNQEVLGPLITVAPTNTTVCAGDTVMLTATVSDNRKISYSWEPAESLSSGSGDTVYAAPTNTTTYRVTGIDTLGCSQTRQARVNIDNGPNVSIIVGDTNVCEGSTVELRAQVFGFGGAEIEWSTGETNQIINYVTKGTDTVSLKATSNAGCSNEVSQILNTVLKPESKYTFTQFNDSFNFFDQSENTNGEVEWFFGDGNESRRSNPIYNYGKSGIFTVTLVSKNPPCPNDTATFDIQSKISNSVLNPIQGIHVGPVPTNDKLNIFNESYEQITHWYILNSIGQQVSHGTIDNNVIDLSRLQSSNYYLILETKSKKGIYPIIKQ